MRQTFGGWLIGQARLGIRPAVSVALYAEKRSDQIKQVRTRIEAAVHGGKIDAEYGATLIGYMEQCHREFAARGRLVDERDPRDWIPLGNGGAMRKRHMGSDGGRMEQ